MSGTVISVTVFEFIRVEVGSTFMKHFKGGGAQAVKVWYLYPMQTSELGSPES
jgi:hypothetical protein